MHDDGFLPRSSPLRRLARPTATVLAGGRAILMELAHPSIAQAVADFDHFQQDPTRRATLTAKAFRNVIHGSEEKASAVGRRLRAVHERVRGEGYAASDPELLLWVHATFIDSLLMSGQQLYGSLSATDQARFYEDAIKVGEMFGCRRSEQPPTLDAFRVYVAATVERLRVTNTARELARAVFWPSVPRNRQGLIRLYRVACFGDLAPELQRQFHWSWTPADRRLYTTWNRAGSFVAPVTDRLFYAVADGNGRGITATLKLAGVR